MDGFGSQADDECAVLTSSGEVHQVSPLVVFKPAQTSLDAPVESPAPSLVAGSPFAGLAPPVAAQQRLLRQPQPQQLPQWCGQMPQQHTGIQASGSNVIPTLGYPSLQPPVPSSPTAVGLPRQILPAAPSSPTMGFRWPGSSQQFAQGSSQQFAPGSPRQMQPNRATFAAPSAPARQSSPAPVVPQWWQISASPRASLNLPQQLRPPAVMQAIAPRLPASASPPVPYSAIVTSPTAQYRGLLQTQTLDSSNPILSKIEAAGILNETAEESKTTRQGAGRDDYDASKLVTTLANVLQGLEADIDLLRRENQDLRERERQARLEAPLVQQPMGAPSSVPRMQVASSQPALTGALSGHSSPVVSWRHIATAGLPQVSPAGLPQVGPGSARPPSPTRSQVMMPGYPAAMPSVTSSPLLSSSRGLLGSQVSVVAPVVPALSGPLPSSSTYVPAGEVPSPPTSARVPGPGNLGSPMVPPSPPYPRSVRMPVSAGMPVSAPVRPFSGAQTPIAGGNPYAMSDASFSADATLRVDGNGLAAAGISSAPAPPPMSTVSLRGRVKKAGSLDLDYQTERELQHRHESLQDIEDFARRGETTRAEEILLGLLTGGMKPVESSYDAVIGAFHRAGDAAKAEEWLWRMIQGGLSPSEANFDAVITSAANAGEAVKAESALLQMMRLQLRPSKPIFDLVINAFCEKKDPAKAEVWMLNAGQSGWTPEAGNFQALVTLYADTDCEKAQEWLKRTLQSGVEPTDDRCFNAVIEAFAHVGAAGAMKAEEWLTRTTEGGREITENAYSETIGALALAGEVGKAEKWLDKMEELGMAPPQQSVRISLFEAAIRIGDVEAAERHLQSMPPDATHREQLACTHAEHGNVAQAEALLEQMRSAGLAPTMETLRVYLGACAAVSDAMRAEACFREIVATSQPPLDVASVEQFDAVLQQALGPERAPALLQELGLVAPPPEPPPKAAPKRTGTRGAAGKASAKVGAARPSSPSRGRGSTRR
eukprot:gnl/MRDRNA2_/MRDRNA2_34776_c0_seq2.p1 gnl/MRDRNA2_/MRDRNA2_34776_c0~~gnl/MRDRNA2_/MRDRNA2_34776_c0_seq2.p1  ORF type:complete len:996 (-),score=184.20 gnl/MRDRNA2_/MRDRNA2_34776_c0_seq2:24-3011(-)